MKWRGLIIGGLLGATATLYISRKRPGAVAWAAGAMSELCHAATGKMAGSMFRSKSGGSQQLAKSVKGDAGRNDKSSRETWMQMEQWIQSDPEVKREVEKIKAESSAAAH
ncbi:hypothetical protein ACX93W_05730 [Paenibacillus sp. CAU 1782]